MPGVTAPTLFDLFDHATTQDRLGFAPYATALVEEILNSAGQLATLGVYGP